MNDTVIVNKDPRLDRRVDFDERSREFPIRALLDLTPRKPISNTWWCNQWLDQGREGACVGFAWAHDLVARPYTHPMSNDRAREIYHTAQTLDPWPGEAYSGTSVLAGVKATQRLYPEFIRSYRWGFSLVDLIDTICFFSPVVLGINWYSGMYAPRDGVVKVTGKVVGGHAILANGIRPITQQVRLHNSWGRSWGINGEALISYQDLDRLLHEDGEMCVPVKI